MDSVSNKYLSRQLCPIRHRVALWADGGYPQVLPGVNVDRALTLPDLDGRVCHQVNKLDQDAGYQRS